MVKINQKKVVKKTVKKTKALAQKKVQPRTEIALFQKRPNRRIKDPVAYFGCMKECCLTGKKITEVARECKHLAPALSASRVKEIKKLTSAYKQIGVSLSRLLRD